MLRLFEQWDGDWVDLMDLWESSRQVRLEMWRSKTSGLSMSDIFEGFPCLNDGRITQLILGDFEFLYANAKASFLLWNTNYKKVLNQARNYRDDFAKSVINQIDFMASDGI